PALGRRRRLLAERAAGAPRLVRVDPGLEVRRPELREGEREVPEIALRVDGDGGDAVDRGLLEERDPEPGLAAAGHADADRVGREVARLEEVGLFGRGALRGVVATAEVEEAELLEVPHARIIANPARGRARARGLVPPPGGDCASRDGLVR